MQTLSSIAPRLDRLTQALDNRIDEVLSGVEATSLREILVSGTQSRLLMLAESLMRRER